VSTTAGTCTALVCTFPVSDGTPPPAPIPGLNAGTITVSATGAAGPAVLTYGPIGDAGFAGYKGVSATGQFFVPGAMVTATGAGGADLPAFGAESVVAPGEITMTSPACMPGGCPDLDRTTDLALAWTGGGAGKVTADLSTSSETTSTSIFCTFAAAGGTGTIPSTLLTKLGKAGDPGISGIESFIPSNEVSFTVGAATTTFSVQAGGAQSLMTVSN
jgi:hypothetical protein